MSKLLVLFVIGLLILVGYQYCVEGYRFKRTGDAYQLATEAMTKGEGFQEMNLPLRTLRVAVVTNAWVSDEHIRVNFADASALLEEQVGVRLKVVRIFHDSTQTTRSLLRLQRFLRGFRKNNPDFDIIAAVSLPASDDEETPCELGIFCSSIAMINEGRNIVFLALYKETIAHEIGHAFLGNCHSPRGIMRPTPSDRYFSIADREKILRNKWKDFRRNPSPIETCLGLC